MDFIVLKAFDNYFTAHIMLTRLQDAGVNAHLLNENLVTNLPFLTNIEGGIKLVVDKKDAERATALFTEFEKEYNESILCPQCRQPALELTDVQEKKEKSSTILGWLNDNYFLNNGFVYKCTNCGFETETPISPDPVAGFITEESENAGQEESLLSFRKMAMIPARYASTRFPYKLMQMLGDKPVIRHTYDNTVATGLFDDVFVVTDSEIIFSEIINNGGKAIMSDHAHESGSDRIAEALTEKDTDVVVNVQGDEPFVDKNALQDLLQAFAGKKGKEVQVASLMKPFYSQDRANDPNVVKLITDNEGNALYFSRSPLPFFREGNTHNMPYYEHIGIYAYRKDALLRFTTWPQGRLEQAEKLEQLRYLEHGVSIKMILTNVDMVKIDVPGDLQKAIDHLQVYYKQ